MKPLTKSALRNLLAGASAWLTLVASMLLIAGIVPAAGSEQPASSDGAAEDQPAVPSLVEAPPPIVDTRDGSAISTEEAAVLDTVLAAQQAERDSLVGDSEQFWLTTSSLQGLAAASRGGLSVTYLNSPPDEVRAVVEGAAAEWSEVLQIPGNAPVEIEFDWRVLPPNILGLAAPTSFEQSPDLPNDVLYPVALANALTNTDLAPGRAEVRITLSAGLYQQSNGWHISTSPAVPVPETKLDLFSVVLHEIGHGLGFTGSARDGALGEELVVFDLLTRYEGQPVVGSGSETEALVSGELFVSIAGDHLAELYAPSRFINRVSYSHFDEVSDPSASAGLMTPAFQPGEQDRQVDAATLGVMSQIGWVTNVSTLTPRIVSLAPGDRQVTIQFSNDPGRHGLPAASHLVTAATPGGELLASETVDGSDQSVTLSSLPNDQDITIQIQAEGTTGSSQTAVVRASDRPRTVGVSVPASATGPTLSRVITWQPPSRPSQTSPSYVVERRRSGGTWTEIGRTSTLAISDTVSAPGVFQYRVIALHSDSATGDVLASQPAVGPIEGISDSPVRPMVLDGQAARLYQAFLGRPPDNAGMEFWVAQRSGGRTLASIADGFAGSVEFLALASDPNDGVFVDLVYSSVLGRPAEPEGREFWIAQLDAGLTRGQLMVGFSEAPEYVAATNTLTPTASHVGPVTRLYWSFLLRQPETDGLNYWAELVAADPAGQLLKVADIFSQTPEFTQTYGELSNQEFLDLVYDNVLGRRAETAGFNYWLAQLEGGLSRGGVMLAFSQSPEFIIRTGTLPS